MKTYSTMRSNHGATFRSVIAVLIGILYFLYPNTSKAAELGQDTLRAWNVYLAEAHQHMLARADGRTEFLWIRTTPEGEQRVRTGEIVVAPVAEHNPRSVPSGLIHDWVGAAFLPGVTLAQVTAVTRDYKNYKTFYGPNVI